MKRIVYASVAAVTACATASKDVTPAYVSPMQYQSYNCEQIAAEAVRIQARVTQLGGRLDEAASNDKTITGVGIVLFWPALFFLGGTKQQEAEYARLSGEYHALQQAAIQKNCSAPGAPAQQTAQAAAEPQTQAGAQSPVQPLNATAPRPTRVALADTALPATMPRRGDVWKYQYVDGFSGQVKQLFVHEVIDAKAGKVDEKMYVAGRSAFADERSFTPADAHTIFERPLPDMDRAEFSPYLQAFGGDSAFANLGPISGTVKQGGYSWDMTGRVIGREFVVVPAGSFDTVKIELHGELAGARFAYNRAPFTMEHVVWYAPKVKRYVKYEVNSKDQFGSLVIRDRFELVEFTLH